MRQPIKLHNMYFKIASVYQKNKTNQLNVIKIRPTLLISGTYKCTKARSNDTTLCKMDHFRTLSISILNIVVFSTLLTVANPKLINFWNNACKEIDLYPMWFLSGPCYYNPDVLSNVPSLAARHNYTVESYYVKTEDDYILTIFRVLPKRITRKHPIFIQHGVATSSGVWFDIRNRSLAFRLSDLGYEVWIGNFRGSTYSRNHATLNVYDPKFWQFQVDQLNKYDLRSQLKFVSNFAKLRSKIIYIGHSMGTTSMFMYGLEAPEEVHGLVEGFIALAPIVYLSGAKVVELGRFLIYLANFLGFKSLFTYETAGHVFLIFICRFIPRICRTCFYLLLGYGDQFADDEFLVMLSYLPTGVSVEQLLHYIQIAKNNKFQKYDLGSKRNMQVYGQSDPPLYDLQKFTIPTYMFYGTLDAFYGEKNLQRLYSELGSTIKHMYKVPKDGKDNFEHIDFLYSKYLDEYLYQDLFKLLEDNFN